MQERRPKEAWEEASSGWRGELAYAAVGGVLVCGFFAVTEWPKHPMETVAIPIGAAVGAAILVPLARFLWCLLWQPWNDMKTRVASLAEDDSHMDESERLIVVLRNYLRQGFELEAYRHRRAPTYETSELDELEDWTHSIVTCLTEYATREQCERFIEADKLCSAGYAVHREWALARIAALEIIIEELDPEAKTQRADSPL